MGTIIKSLSTASAVDHRITKTVMKKFFTCLSTASAVDHRIHNEIMVYVTDYSSQYRFRSRP